MVCKITEISFNYVVDEIKAHIERQKACTTSQIIANNCNQQNYKRKATDLLKMEEVVDVVMVEDHFDFSFNKKRDQGN